VIQRTKSLAALNVRAWRVLIDQLGAADALRFIGQFDMGSGNYATDRDAWQEGLTIEDIVADIKRHRRAKGKGKRTTQPQRKKASKNRQA
jgi:hypothetical protein